MVQSLTPIPKTRTNPRTHPRMRRPAQLQTEKRETKMALLGPCPGPDPESACVTWLTLFKRTRPLPIPVHLWHSSRG